MLGNHTDHKHTWLLDALTERAQLSNLVLQPGSYSVHKHTWLLHALTQCVFLS